MLGGGCCGGNSQCEITQEIVDLVNNNVSALNARTGANASSYTVVKAKSQVVAGRNYHLHLNSNTGAPFTATIFVPLPGSNDPVQVTRGEAGHNAL